MEYPMEYLNIPWTIRKIVWNILWNIQIFHGKSEKSYGISYGIPYGISKDSIEKSEKSNGISYGIVSDVTSNTLANYMTRQKT